MKVYQAIGAVSAAMSREGISKARSNQQQGYKFRGIDDVLNALSSALVASGLVILPRCTDRTVVERTTSKGGALFNVCCRVEFDLVSTEDGSTHTVATYGEAMDSADKATNKAMSAAYKYLALLVFCIPTEASPETDADFSTHEVAHRGMADHILADWLTYVEDASTVGELKARAAEAEAACNEVNDSAALAKVQAAVATKVAKAAKKVTV